MLNTFTISQAKPKLGQLLDQAGAGRTIYLRRKTRLFRIEPIAEAEPIPHRPSGYFDIEANDPLVALANSAPQNFGSTR